METYPAQLSAKFIGSFAYATIKDRLPVILTKLIDSLHRQKDDILAQYGKNGVEQLKVIIGGLSKLRNEVQTNKELTYFKDNLTDVQIWNDMIRCWIDKHGEAPKWFNDPWLLLECYMYRRINGAINLSDLLSGKIDPFRQQKQDSFTGSSAAIDSLLAYLKDAMQQNSKYGVREYNVKETFLKFLKVSLWSNKCDLSISALSENIQNIEPLSQLGNLQSQVLVDDSDHVWEYLYNNIKNNHLPRIDIVLDNAGFELMADLCFAEFLVSNNLAGEVHFHGKSMPWFVSDVTEQDFKWTIDQLCTMNAESTSNIGKIWQQRLKDGTWLYKDNSFWTTSYDYSEMMNVSPDLYSDLSKSNLIILKGDLNYRKLTGDLQWAHTTLYDTALRGFHPAPHCALRTLKADVVVGLREGQDKIVETVNSDWMTTGEYAVIQFTKKKKVPTATLR